MDYKKIGSFIQLRRKQIGLTQKQLGEKLKVTDKAVSKWENGLGCPDVSLLGELSEILEVGIGEILNGEYNDNLKDNSEFVKNAVDYSRRITEETIYSKIRKVLYCVLILIVFYISFMGIKQFIYLNNEVEVEISDQVIQEYNEIKEKISLIKEKGYIDNIKDYDSYVMFLDAMIYNFDSNNIFSSNKRNLSEIGLFANAFMYTEANCQIIGSILKQIDPENLKYYIPICKFEKIDITNDMLIDDEYVIHERLYYYDRMDEFDKINYYYESLDSRLYKINTMLDFVIEVGERNE